MLTVKRLRGMPQLSAQRRLGEQSPECRGERGGISGRNEKTRLFVFYNVLDRADRRRHHGEAMGHSLHNRHRQVLFEGRQNQNITLEQEPTDLFGPHPARKIHSTGKTAPAYRFARHFHVTISGDERIFWSLSFSNVASQ